MEKDQIIQSVKKWVQIDNEMRQLREELNKRKKLKDNISLTLLTSMKEHNIDTFDLNDGKNRPLTASQVIDCISLGITPLFSAALLCASAYIT